MLSKFWKRAVFGKKAPAWADRMAREPFLIPKRDGTGFITFATFARDHNEHVHCVGCGGCIVDPNPELKNYTPIWCVGCRDKVKTNLPDGAKLAWMWEAA